LPPNLNSMAQFLGTSPAITVIDDDAAVRSAIKLLAVSLGWTVRVFGSAEEFLAKRTTFRSDCLVVDLQMPGMNGVELLEALRAMRIDTPAIVITAHGNDPLLLRATSAGADTIITKPFRDEALRNGVEHALLKS